MIDVYLYSVFIVFALIMAANLRDAKTPKETAALLGFGFCIAATWPLSLPCIWLLVNAT